MRTILAIGLIVLGFASMGLSFDNEAVPDIRSDVHEHMENQNQLEKIFKSSEYPSNAVSTAYKGLARAMMADGAMLPTTKYTYFEEGKKLIESAVKARPKNIEIRYIRLLVQSNSPSFLGYNKAISKDLNVFVSGLKASEIPSSWKHDMITNLLATEGLSSTQRTTLKTEKRKLATS